MEIYYNLENYLNGNLNNGNKKMLKTLEKLIYSN